MAIQCEICDSQNLLKQDGVFVCQDCGAKYSIEEIRKMVSGKAQPPQQPPVQETVQAEKEAPVEPEQKPEEDVVQLLQWAESAFEMGNDGAGNNYLRKAQTIAPYDHAVLRYRLAHNSHIGRDFLKRMIQAAPAEKQAEEYEFAYELMDAQGEHFGFPCGDIHADVHPEKKTVKYLLQEIMPQLRMENFWDFDRLMEMHFKNIIRALNEVKLPDPDIEEGIFARTEWGYVASIFRGDAYLQEADAMIPASRKEELYTAFYNACDRILKGRFCCEDYKTHRFVRVTDSTNIYGKDWKNAKKIRKKYKDMLEQINREREAAIAAEKERQEREAKAAKEAERAAYWAEHPEEMSKLKQEKALLEAKITKLEKQHQVDDQKKEMERAGYDLQRYEEELHRCGIFQGKRKKELQQLIEECRNKEQNCRVAYEKNTREYEQTHRELKTRWTEINRKLNRE